jgi:hypothetical protein
MGVLATEYDAQPPHSAGTFLPGKSSNLTASGHTGGRRLPPTFCGRLGGKKMRTALKFVALASTLAWSGTIAHAQTPPAPTPPQQQQPDVAPNPKLNLTLEQRHTIREFIKDMKADASSPNTQATVGEAVPAGVSPQPMPADVGRKVPQVKTHTFFVTAQQIVIVDPKDNKVAEIIKLTAD